MNKVVLGRYLDLGGWLNKIDPRIKIIVMILMLVLTFFLQSFVGYGILFGLLLIACISARVPLKMIISAIKPMIFMSLFLFIVNIFQLQNGELWFHWGWLKIYSDAVYTTLFILLRLILMIIITTLLTVTTKPLDMTLAIEDLLSPFAKLGLPAHEIALMISIALRFIPTLIEETQRIMQAQASRGVDFDEGSIKEKISGIVSLIIPIFVSALNRAEELADAMETRGYVPGMQRTRYRSLKIKFYDIVLFLFVSGLIGAVIYIQNTGIYAL